MPEEEMTEVEVEATPEPDVTQEQQDPVAALERRLALRLDEFEDALSLVGSQVRGVQGRADSAHTILASMQEALEQRYAPKRALTLLEKMVRENPVFGDAAWEQFERDGKLDELSNAVKAKTDNPPPPPAARNFQQEWEAGENRKATAIAKRFGLDQDGYNKARSSFGKTVEGDFRGSWTDWHLAWRDHVEEFSERQKPPPSRTEFDNTKGVTAVKKTWKDAQNIKNPADISDAEYFTLVGSA